MGKLIFTSAFFNPVEEIIQGTAPAIKSRGGLLVGNSHDEGGIPAVVEDTEPIEVEGGEAIINKKAVSKKGTKVRKGKKHTAKRKKKAKTKHKTKKHGKEKTR